MENLARGWCTWCNSTRHSNIKGFFRKHPTGTCLTCGTRLVERSSTNETADRRASDTTMDALSIILASNALNDTYHKHDSVTGHGGDFGGAGASSSWDSSSSDSSSSSSDSGGGGGD